MYFAPRGRLIAINISLPSFLPSFLYSHGVVSGMYSQGVVSGMYSHGTVSGMYSHGAVSGIYSHGAVSGMYSHGAISGMYSHGVLSGMYSHGVVSGMYSHGAISGMYSRGILSGMYSWGVHQNSHNLGEVFNATQTTMSWIDPPRSGMSPKHQLDFGNGPRRSSPAVFCRVRGQTCVSVLDSVLLPDFEISSSLDYQLVSMSFV